MVTTHEIIEWLDSQIEATKILKQVLIIEKHDDGIDDEIKNFTINATDGIHIGADSVRYIAERLDIRMWVRNRPRDTENPYEISVLYKGVMFFGIETEAEYKERGAVV